MVAVLLIFPLGKISAQAPTHEISVQGGLGISGLKMSMNQGDSKQKFGGNIGFGYTYFFNQNFGINTGLEVSFLSSEAKFANASNEYNTVDSNGESFQFRSQIGKYKETHRTIYLNIPIMGQFQTVAFSDHQFYCAFGFKIGLPVTNKFETDGASLKASGYYPQHDMTIDDLPHFGFGNFNSRAVDKKVDLKTSFMLAAEAGMKWEINESLAVYTGAYIDYGLNNVNKSSDKVFMVYDTFDPVHYATNSMLESQYTQNGESKKFVDKVRPMTVGLKVRFAFKGLQ